MTVLIQAAVVTIGGQLLAGKIASNRANDPKGAIGTGTRILVISEMKI